MIALTKGRKKQSDEVKTRLITVWGLLRTWREKKKKHTTIFACETQLVAKLPALKNQQNRSRFDSMVSRR
jgi:hypothetical protein